MSLKINSSLSHSTVNHRKPDVWLDGWLSKWLKFWVCKVPGVLRVRMCIGKRGWQAEFQRKRVRYRYTKMVVSILNCKQKIVSSKPISIDTTISVVSIPRPYQMVFIRPRARSTEFLHLSLSLKLHSHRIHS